jgi:hypothetical protein
MTLASPLALLGIRTWSCPVRRTLARCVRTLAEGSEDRRTVPGIRSAQDQPDHEDLRGLLYEHEGNAGG